jgi:pimeloyl-ACP methyl ester carboxylesterase
VRHPERVSHLIILGGFVRGWAKRSPASECGTRLVEMVRVGWGARSTGAYRRMFAELFIAATEEHMAWFDGYNAARRRRRSPPRIMEVSGNIDVVHRLAQVKAPTLVMHSRGDVIVPFEQGRVIAAGIPNARFVELDSANHLAARERTGLGNSGSRRRFFSAGAAWRHNAASLIRRPHPKNWRCSRRVSARSLDPVPAVPTIRPSPNSCSSARRPCATISPPSSTRLA